MPRVIPSPVSGVTIVLLDLDGPPALISEWTAVLDEAERARAGRFVFEHHRRRFIAGRGQLRVQLGALLGQRPGVLRIEALAHGKPWLPDAPQLLFNLSHTEDRGLLAWRLAADADERLGVDIEAPRPLRDLLALARHSFSDREFQQVAALDEPKRSDLFYEIWTKKEAVIKAHGDGVGYGLQRFSVPSGGGPLDFADPTEQPAFWDIRALDLGNDDAAAVAFRAGSRTPTRLVI